MVRTGGQKSLIYNKCKNNSGNVDAPLCAGEKGKMSNYWSTNPYGDGSLDDHLGFGIGLNIERKLKIDITIAEDLFFRNPFSGEGRFFSRIAAVYMF
jgi:hypothetical protein